MKAIDVASLYTPGEGVSHKFENCSKSRNNILENMFRKLVTILRKLVNTSGDLVHHFRGVRHYSWGVSHYYHLETGFHNFETSFEKFGGIMATGGYNAPTGSGLLTAGRHKL